MTGKKADATAVLLLAFGGPESLDSVEPFLRSVLSRRPLTEEKVQKAKERYKTIGGKSPLLDITKRQARALQSELSRVYDDLRVYIGMRHWHPYINDTLQEMSRDGINKAVAVSMAPQNSKASTGGYTKAVREALEKTSTTLEVGFVETWHNNPYFLQALARKIEEGLSKFPEEKRKDVHIIFSAHSLPLRLVENDPYVDQINETISGVLDLIGPRDYTLAYQSKGGAPVEWLGPDVDSVLEKLAKKDNKDVLLVPVGFVTDHVETLYDIDVVYRKKAESVGLDFKRTESFNDSPEFIEALSKIISEKLEKSSVGV